MSQIKRYPRNPILSPNPDHPWESVAAFNGCPVIDGDTIHLLYRALGEPQDINGQRIQISTIGYANSPDGLSFGNRRQLITPSEGFDRFGCEDPRITRMGDTFYIFYTGLGGYPFGPDNIKVSVAVTHDFKHIEKHPVTPFNAKAMALFPHLIDGRMAVILTANTDQPPARVGIAYFDKPEDIWSVSYWDKWYGSLNNHALPLERTKNDHIEIGAPPIRTDVGWLLIYSHIQNYFAPPATFGIEAVLLHLDNPLEIIGRTSRPLIVPEEPYEVHGIVPNIAFPSGAYIDGEDLRIYYGAADTHCAVATVKLDSMLYDLIERRTFLIRADRYKKNPIMTPVPEHEWEAKAVSNAAAFEEEGKIHLVYRAVSHDNTSVMGYATSEDGFTISERLPKPIYEPRVDFEAKHVPGGNSGCEDPRITRINDTYYMLYTAFNGSEPPRVAMTSISVSDFLARRWDAWKMPVLISPPEVDDKDSAIFPRKVNGKYAILHRLGVNIWLDFVDTLHFDGKSNWLGGKVLMTPRKGPTDSKKIGTAGPPIETDRGWLLIYHGISKKEDNHYHLRAALLDINDPSKVLARTSTPILNTETGYEKYGVVDNVVFSCGAVVRGDTVFIYYGAADTVIGVATIGLKDLVDKLIEESV